MAIVQSICHKNMNHLDPSLSFSCMHVHVCTRTQFNYFIYHEHTYLPRSPNQDTFLIKCCRAWWKQVPLMLSFLPRYLPSPGRSGWPLFASAGDKSWGSSGNLLLPFFPCLHPPEQKLSLPGLSAGGWPHSLSRSGPVLLGAPKHFRSKLQNTPGLSQPSFLEYILLADCEDEPCVASKLPRYFSPCALEVSPAPAL